MRRFMYPILSMVLVLNPGFRGLEGGDDPDGGDIFIVDAALDSIFKYASRGVLKKESFGLILLQGVMHRPSGLAFFDKVLHVLDHDQGLVLRFRLSTDVPR